MITGLLAAPGETVERNELRLPKAQQLATFLAESGAQVFAKLLEVRRLTDRLREVLVVELDVERPQRLTHDIRRREVLAICLDAADERQPEVVALRADFPTVPHCNATQKGSPRSLCLYDEPYEAVRLTWTPLRFMRRVHQWLSKTATGTLHLPDQPLEPLIFASPVQLVVPADFSASDIHQTPRMLHISHQVKNGKETTYVAEWTEPTERAKIHSIVAAFSTAPQAHGVLQNQPQTLEDLDTLCRAGGLELVSSLASLIQAWHRNKPVAKVLQAQLIIVIALPKTRGTGGIVEATETRAFLTGTTVQELGEKLGVIVSVSDVEKGAAGYIIGTPAVSADRLHEVPLLPVQVLHALSRDSSARMNGTTRNDASVVAIGCGALGSQVVSHFMRAGFGKWTLVDYDTFLPHNAARHLLPAAAVGHNKATAVSQIANHLAGKTEAATAIPANVLKPEEHDDALRKALSSADSIFDFSASVPVSRHLSASATSPRTVTAFVTPSGDGAVLAIEDRERSIRQDWLEMFHYREVLNRSSLRQSLRAPDANFRYGNGCRDITTQLGQASVAIWSGVVAKLVPSWLESPKAALAVFEMREDASIVTHAVSPTPPTRIELLGWTLFLDEWLIRKLTSYREMKLPNETGGVLLGVFDTAAKKCYLIDTIPSPPDSTEWPTSYMRGCKGLQDAVDEVEAITLGQVGYAGEWHSHPRRASVFPSGDDRTAYAWLCDKMNLEGLPAVMLIIGDDDRFLIVAAEGMT